jgi:hypothetical protein
MRLSPALPGLCAILSLATETSAQTFVPNVTCVATSRQVPGYIDEQFLVSDDGMLESPPGSGKFVVSRDARGWNSQYGVVAGRNDETPIVEFRVAEPVDLAGMMIWNMPGPRGFQSVSVQYADPGGQWQFLPGTFEFLPANAEGEVIGQPIPFDRPLRAARIRLWCHGTHRGRFGQPDVAGLYRVRLLQSSQPAPPVGTQDDTSAFPLDSGVVNLKHSPYFAKGDGETDDTLAIQRAMSDLQATRRYAYLPAGTYLVSDTLSFKPGYFFGDNNLRGDGPGKTIIRLIDGVFPSPDDPKPVITFGYQGGAEGNVSADWFNNNLRDLTIDVGKNAGAIGVQFYSNNAGSARDLEIRAAEGFGRIGLDLGYKDQNGPLLVKNLRVEGFDVGIAAGNSVNSQTLSGVVLRGQRSLAVSNEGQCLTIEGLSAEGPSPRVRSKWGFLTLVDTTLKPLAPVSGEAVSSGEFLCAVNLKTSGFEKSIVSEYPEPKQLDEATVDEFFSSEVAGGGQAIARPHVERKPTPEVSVSPEARWVNVRNFRNIDELDDAAAFQRAIDSGAEVVYLPATGAVTLGATVTIRGNLQRIVGFQSQLRVLEPANPAFRIEATRHGQLVIEDLIDLGVVENRSDKTLIMKNIQGIDGRLLGSGDVLLENTVGDFEIGPQQRVWSRQMNTEREGTKLVNRGGQLVIIGLKTERGGTLVETIEGGRSEVFGGLCYTTTRGELAPMFVNRDSSLWVAIGEVCYTGDPFRELVRDQQGDTVRQWKRGEVPRRFDFLQGSALLYDGRR